MKAIKQKISKAVSTAYVAYNSHVTASKTGNMSDEYGVQIENEYDPDEEDRISTGSQKSQEDQEVHQHVIEPIITKVSEKDTSPLPHSSTSPSSVARDAVTNSTAVVCPNESKATLVDSFSLLDFSSNTLPQNDVNSKTQTTATHAIHNACSSPTTLPHAQSALQSTSAVPADSDFFDFQPTGNNLKSTSPAANANLAQQKKSETDFLFDFESTPILKSPSSQTKICQVVSPQKTVCVSPKPSNAQNNTHNNQPSNCKDPFGDLFSPATINVQPQLATQQCAHATPTLTKAPVTQTKHVISPEVQKSIPIEKLSVSSQSKAQSAGDSIFFDDLLFSSSKKNSGVSQYNDVIPTTTTPVKMSQPTNVDDGLFDFINSKSTSSTFISKTIEKEKNIHVEVPTAIYTQPAQCKFSNKISSDASDASDLFGFCNSPATKITGAAGSAAKQKTTPAAQSTILKEKGNEFYKQGKLEEAVHCYSMSISSSSDSNEISVCLTNRAMCNAQWAKFDDVIADCTAAIEANSTYAKAFLRRGMALESLEKYKRAVSDFTSAKELDPSNRQASDGLQRCLKALSQL